MLRSLSWFLSLTLIVCAANVRAADPPAILSPEEKAQLESEWKTLGREIETLRTAPDKRDRDQEWPQLFADACLHHRSVEWALKYEPAIKKSDAELIRRTIARGRERVRQLAAGKPEWVKKGRLSRAYTSKIDGSVQPYGLLIPGDYDREKPHRLDVVLHGSMGPAGINEVRFLKNFDEPAANAKAPEYFELHPLGRMENCYRWAGETDVFEAIEDVCRKYSINRDQIVLRGMSMGASGTWHLGLKHPDRFAALGPYCGYVDTHRFSQTPIARFPVVGPLPHHQELGLHMLDSVDYAANIGMVPTVACIGDKDIFFEAHEIMGRAVRKEGLKFTNLISHGTGHVIDPETHKEQLSRIANFGVRNSFPDQVRFVTWTLKYSDCHWLRVMGLNRHYDRADIAAQVIKDEVGRAKKIEVIRLSNITHFAIRNPAWGRGDLEVRILGKLVPITPDVNRAHSDGGIFSLRDGQWAFRGPLDVDNTQLHGKRPGLQGPIDDAFTTPFLCVRGTGKGWNPAVQKYADAALDRFAAEWHQYFRGTLPIKNDRDVSEEDVKSKNLILFGDPGSNSWIARVLPRMPVEWSSETIRFRGETYPAANHLPAFIQPNPLPGAADRYVVINSGHTFRGKDLGTINYLLFPRWGDWAMLRIAPELKPEQEPAWETVLEAGYFDEQWLAPVSP